jgi:hypothetical protein
MLNLSCIDLPRSAFELCFLTLQTALNEPRFSSPEKAMFYSIRRHSQDFVLKTGKSLLDQKNLTALAAVEPKQISDFTSIASSKRCWKEHVTNLYARRWPYSDAG